MIKLYPDAQLITKPVFDLPSFSKFVESKTALKPLEAIEPEYLKNFNHCDTIPMMAGKLCYLSFSKDKGRNHPNKHLENLIKSKHGSVLEHTNIGFILMTSRDISHEIVRHRLASYSQLSQRYVNFPQFLCPPELFSYIRNDKQNDNKYYEYITDDGVVQSEPNSPFCRWVSSMISAKEEYNYLAERLKDDINDTTLSRTDIRKLVNQTARSVLPNSTVTYIFMTANIRSWRTILESRTSIHAATGIRLLFNRVFDQIRQAAPECFQDYNKVMNNDGTFSIITENNKV